MYGTTTLGGAYGSGSVFKITPLGKLTTLYSFCARRNCPDGAEPDAGLVQGTDGNFYGTTQVGACLPYSVCGTVFRITAQGSLTTLYRFCSQPNCTDGMQPYAGLVQGSDGAFYGTTVGNGNGTVFKITSEGSLTTLHSFDETDGSQPTAGLVQGTDGNFYGTTYGGGASLDGTVFRMTPEGTLTTLYSFCGQTNCTDGYSPTGGLLQATNGNFYGTTFFGGIDNDGTVFVFSMGLGPFVSFVRNPAKVGGSFGILGQGLTGTTSVSLNGTPANFTVKSDTLLVATVPAGATTGFVTVTTPSGTLTSNVPFHVMQ